MVKTTATCTPLRGFAARLASRTRCVATNVLISSSTGSRYSPGTRSAAASAAPAPPPPVAAAAPPPPPSSARAHSSARVALSSVTSSHAPNSETCGAAR